MKKLTIDEVKKLNGNEILKYIESLENQEEKISDKVQNLINLSGKNITLDRMNLQIRYEIFLNNQTLNNSEKERLQALIIKTSNLLSNYQEFYDEQWDLVRDKYIKPDETEVENDDGNGTDEDVEDVNRMITGTDKNGMSVKSDSKDYLLRG
ncbi:hypothetical protein CRU96_12760 [Malaciobacter halophilus]|nr:hypothetical protein [Malaciobacter halophilus]RYA22489.1 hypothetical protein CRU96_12760 [Malaciobacter halophilus]